jgi:hypothetical protein
MVFEMSDEVAVVSGVLWPCVVLPVDQVSGHHAFQVKEHHFLNSLDGFGNHDQVNPEFADFLRVVAKLQAVNDDLINVSIELRRPDFDLGRVVTDHLQRTHAHGLVLARKVMLDQEVQSLVLGIQENERVVF